jgi:peptidoglycan/LPS O-acetylase OafA/YrhL
MVEVQIASSSSPLPRQYSYLSQSDVDGTNDARRHERCAKDRIAVSLIIPPIARRPEEFKLNENERYQYIDALRGWAVLIVVLAHATYLMTYPVPEAVRRILGHGYVGTDLLLIATGLSMSCRWSTASLGHAGGLRRYAIRRACRIMPLFYLGIALYLILRLFDPRNFGPSGIDWLDVALTACFLHNWRWSSLNSVVPGDWSIGAVATFYVLFPLLVRWARSWRLFAAVTVGWVVVTQALNVYTQAHHFNEAFAWSFPGSGVFFLFGMAAARLNFHREEESRKRPADQQGSIFGAMVSVFLMGFLIVGLPLWHLPEPILTYRIQACVIGALLCVQLHRSSPRLIVNPLIASVGRMTFSIFVLHTIVLLHVGAVTAELAALIPEEYSNVLLPAIYMCTVVFGSLALGFVGYFLVEQPGIRFGRSLTSAQSALGIQQG